jgi:hypothetical protein
LVLLFTFENSLYKLGVVSAHNVPSSKIQKQKENHFNTCLGNIAGLHSKKNFVYFAHKFLSDMHSTFSPSLWLFFPFSYAFTEKFLSLVKFKLLIFSFMNYAFGFVPKNSSIKPNSPVLF